MPQPKPVVLTILDGWGVNEEEYGNALVRAYTPNFDRLFNEYPSTELEASGEAVGLPEGQMGNSEVGHLNIGAGRIVYQEFTRINKAIEDSSFYQNQVLLAAVKAAKNNNKSLHLMGLLSDGGVHSHIEHLFALIDFAKENGLEEIYIHAFLDGRDVPPDNAEEYVNKLEEKLKRTGIGKIATVMGRYYAMDRDNRWDRVELAYKAMVEGEGPAASSAVEAVRESYQNGVTDEFVKPAVIVSESGSPNGTVKNGDSIIFFNFRADRAREITRAFIEEDFENFERPGGYLDPNFVCMTQYDKEIDAPVAFPPQNLNDTLGEILALNEKKQLRIAETEKYAHVTFFFNGGVEKPNKNEERILIDSPKVATYDLKPEMSANEVAEKLIECINTDTYDVIVVNFANPDMVGHTGVMEAAVEAVEVVDKCLGRVFDSVMQSGGAMMVTGDHGNVEVMYDENGDPHTAHTERKVPFILIGDKGLNEKKLRNGGALRDIAPTLLKLLEIPKPKEMTGELLIID